MKSSQKLTSLHTHVILFRLVNHFEKPYITKRWMEEENIYKNCQSICKINDDTFTKIMNKSNFNYCIDKGNEL